MSTHPIAEAASALLLPMDSLLDLAREQQAAYTSAQPFPHIVLDDFLPPTLLQQVVAEFPAPDSAAWYRFRDPAQRKLASEGEALMGPVTRLLMYQLNSVPVLDFLSLLTGIPDLMPDPYFTGGGLHQITRGGFLKVHADFNRHPKLHLERRLNLLIYLNEDWDDAYGGHLELWNADMTRCEKRIAPRFNRCVVFTTTDTSYHGHPEPLACPPDRSRRSLALYYYTNAHSSPEAAADHSTLFQARPGETIKPSLQAQLKPFLPPILLDLLRRVRRADR